MSHADDILQAAQFFRDRIARGEDYEKHHSHNGDADEDKDTTGEHDVVRENPAHKNVFHRPDDH